MSMKTVGIIGFGSFGKFLAEKLSSHAKVLVYSEGGQANSWAASFDEVAACDVVIPAVPLSAYPEVLNLLAGSLRPDSVIVDICSVKVKPVEMITEILPHQPRVATHPMFGPESASVSFAEHTLVMCPEVSTPGPYDMVKRFAETLDLKVVEMTTQAHDQEIAVVQGLAFFVGRALNEFGIHDQKLRTPSFESLLSVAELEQHHSIELFRTIQTGNPWSEDVRTRFIDAARQVNADLQSGDR